MFARLVTRTRYSAAFGAHRGMQHRVNKVFASADEAVADIKDSSTLCVGENGRCCALLVSWCCSGMISWDFRTLYTCILCVIGAFWRYQACWWFWAVRHPRILDPSAVEAGRVVCRCGEVFGNAKFARESLWFPCTAGLKELDGCLQQCWRG